MKLTRKILVTLLVLALALCIAPAAFAAEDGTEQNPYIFADGMFGAEVGVDTKDNGDYTYFQVTAENAGYISVNINFLAPNADSWDEVQWDAVIIGCANTTTGAYEYVEITPDTMSAIIPVMVNVGDVLLFDVQVMYDWNPFGVYVSLTCMMSGTAEFPLNVPGYEMPYALSVGNGDTVYFSGRPWAGYAGAIITTMSGREQSKIATTTVIVNGVEYTDTDGDGKIEVPFTQDETYYNYSLGIKNGYTGMPMSTTVTYAVTFTAEPQMECTHPNAVDVEAKDADYCHVNGNIAHKACPDCGELMDANGNTLTLEQVTVLAPNNDKLVLVAGKAPTCTEPGMADHWYCSACQGHYADEAGTEFIEDLNTLIIEAPGHALVEMEACDATCGQPGSAGYYWCFSVEEGVPSCYKYFKDAEGTQELTEEEAILPLDPDNHVWVEEEVLQEHSCEQDGIIKYRCEYCYDYENDKPITKTETTPAHTLDHVEATDENIEYWVCADCGKLFADAEAKNEITDDADLIPPTGDVNIYAIVAITMVSMGGILVLAKKKEF